MRAVKGGRDYIQLIKSVKGMCLSIEDVYSTFPMMSHLRRIRGQDPLKAFYIRHDVDVSIDKAIQLAQVEAEAGIVSTYFLLHTAKYFDYSQDFARKVQKLTKLGHSIGFHNNLLTRAFILQEKPLETAKKALTFLRDVAGVVVATSCHGEEPCYRLKIRNYEIFDEFNPLKNEAGGRLIPEDFKLSMGELGLKIETNLYGCDYYLSDSHGQWYGIFCGNGVPMPFERTIAKFELADDGLKLDPYQVNFGLNILTKFNRGWHPNGLWEPKPRLLQILFHPYWWEIE